MLYESYNLLGDLYEASKIFSKINSNWNNILDTFKFFWTIY